MKDGKLKITPFILAVILILLAMAAELVYLGDFEYRFRTKRFNRILKEKEKVMDNCLERDEANPCKRRTTWLSH